MKTILISLISFIIIGTTSLHHNVRTQTFKGEPVEHLNIALDGDNIEMIQSTGDSIRLEFSSQSFENNLLILHQDKFLQIISDSSKAMDIAPPIGNWQQSQGRNSENIISEGDLVFDLTSTEPKFSKKESNSTLTIHMDTTGAGIGVAISTNGGIITNKE